MITNSLLSDKSLPIPASAIVAYLVAMGIVFTLILGIGVLILLAYMTQLFLTMLVEIGHQFGSLPPLVQFLALLLFVVLTLWRVSSHLKKVGPACE